MLATLMVVSIKFGGFKVGHPWLGFGLSLASYERELYHTFLALCARAIFTCS